jgi:hypothetical protein
VGLTDREILHGESVDRELGRLAEKRSRDFGAEAASEFARQQARAAREQVEDQRELRRELWRRHHSRMAGIHAALAEQNRVKAERLGGLS